MALLNKRRILLIDDQASIHEDYRKIIGASSSVTNRLDDAEVELFGGVRPQMEKTECYEIDSAFSGEEAIRMVERSLEEGRPYAVAFVDIRMPPGIDGVKTMRRIWQIDAEILAVMCSSGNVPLRGSISTNQPRSTVHTEAQIGPPMLNVAASLGSLTCNSAGACPFNCSADQPIMAIPVAPIG